MDNNKRVLEMRKLYVYKEYIHIMKERFFKPNFPPYPRLPRNKLVDMKESVTIVSVGNRLIVDRKRIYVVRIMECIRRRASL